MVEDRTQSEANNKPGLPSHPGLGVGQPSVPSLRGAQVSVPPPRQKVIRGARKSQELCRAAGIFPDDPVPLHVPPLQ